jgi:PIN domain nuclease of toxin-antitoxin system
VSRLLIDTNALLWWLTDAPELTPTAREAIADPADEPLVSAASAWEIAIKVSLGRLDAPDDIADVIVAEGFAWLPVEAAHAWGVRELPMHHRDPFDRLLVSQALAEGLPVVTADPRFAHYGVAVRW